MGAGHTHRYYTHGDSAVHRIVPEAKLAATVAFVLVVVATPRDAFWAFGADALVIAAIAVLSGIRIRHVLRRLVIEVPFLAFAFFLPIVGGGERVEVAGVSLSTAGLWGAWNILVKGTLGVAAVVVLASTTTIEGLLVALDRLRIPTLIVQITVFMVRYLDVVGENLDHMRIARESRGSDPRWSHQARAVGRTAGALFVRSYERGERVHLAMLARGYHGRMPMHTAPRDAAPDGAASWLSASWTATSWTAASWTAAFLAPAAAAVVCAIAWVR